MPAAQKPGKPSTAEPIASKDNRWLKQFRAALRDRDTGGEVLGLEGPHLVADACRAGMEIPAILVAPSGEPHLEILRRQIPPQTQILRTSDKLFETVAATRTPQGLAALAVIRRATLDDVLAAGRTVPLLLILVAVQDPGNVGTLLRAAEGFGATGIVATAGSANPWGQKALRASAGSALRLPVLAGISAPVVMAQLRMAGVKLIATAAREGLLPAQADWLGPAALLIGNEGAGLPADVLRSADQTVHIPLAANIESLNAAVAASVLLYEAARQRGRS